MEVKNVKVSDNSILKGALKIKEWFYEKNIRFQSANYDMCVLVDHDENGVNVVEDECVFATVTEFLEETEKAVKVAFRTTAVKDWTCWIPKSVVLEKRVFVA